MTVERKLLKKIAAAQLKKKQIEAQGKRKIEPNLKKISDALDEYYLFGKLKAYCAYLSYTQIISQEKLEYERKDFKLISSVLEEIESGQYQHPAIIIYDNIRRLFEHLVIDKEDLQLSLYKETEALIKAARKTFTVEERLELYSFLSNFCIRKGNSGFTDYWEYLFLLNNDLINLKYARKRSANEILPASLFKNIVAVAIRLKNTPLLKPIKTIGLTMPEENGFKNRLEWVEQFITVYHLKLEKTVRQIYYDYTTALLAFYKKDYLAAYKQLGSPTHVQGMIFNLNIKILQLKILYEVNYYHVDFLEMEGIEIKRVLEAYRGLIRDEKKRKRQLTYHLPFFEDFELAFRKLYLFYEKYQGKLDNGRNPQFIRRKEALLQEINQFNYTYKPWFESKLKAIG